MMMMCSLKKQLAVSDLSGSSNLVTGQHWQISESVAATAHPSHMHRHMGKI